MSEEFKNFSHEEIERVRAFLFTNPHGETGFVYPQELVAGEELSPLMSAYSRTHVPFQERVLSFLDIEKPEQTRAMLPLIEQLTDIFREPDGTLKVSRRTGAFNRKWVLGHGHASIKEETSVFGYAEEVPDITGKKITGHPLNRPQVKSTRYISYGSRLNLALDDPDIAALPNADEFIDHLAHLNSRYTWATDRLAEHAFVQPMNKRYVEHMREPERVDAVVERARMAARDQDKPFGDVEERRAREKYLDSFSDEAVFAAMERFVLDASRVYLPAATRTSVGFSADARTIEAIITDMLSTPRVNDSSRGQDLWDEARKIAPVLLGEKSHVKVDPWKVHNETVLREYLADRFSGIPVENHSHEEMIRLITSDDVRMYTDRWNAALALFPHVDASILDIHAHISDQDVDDILDKVHEHRGEYDIIHPSISHGGLVTEWSGPYHGYRDLFRHRRGSRSVQLLTTQLGFEVPELFVSAGIDDILREDMEANAALVERARQVSPHVAELMVAFAHNCRALHTWQPDQIGYIGGMRTDIAKGNLTYVRGARELMRAMEGVMPKTASFLKYDKREYPVELWKKAYGWYDQGGADQ